MKKLKDREMVNQLIKTRTLLREAEYSDVYLSKDVSPDKSIAQKKLCEELRFKGKKTHIIFQGKFIPCS